MLARGRAIADKYNVLSFPNLVNEHPADDSAPAAPPEDPEMAIDGAEFVLDQPASIPAIWGRGRHVLWASGEALMVCGGQGLGKTTLAGQITRGLLGLGPNAVLGLPISDLGCRILYLAMDRPQQIARSLRRQFGSADREVLRERLVVWQGPPPRDLAANPALLAKMAAHYKAGVVVVDSLKDAAVRLSEDSVGAQWNRARQNLLAQGCQILELHHAVKRGPQGAPVKGVADIYGSVWLTSGCGSIVLLGGEPGDPIVSFRHLKQPCDEVGPYRLLHDQDTGVLTVEFSVDLIALVKANGPDGLTAKDAASALFDKENPDRADIEKARRKLNDKANEGLLIRIDGGRGGGDIRSTTAWFLAAPDQSRGNHANCKTAGRAITHPTTPESNHVAITSITRDQEPAGQTNHAPRRGNHAHSNHENSHPFRGEVSDAQGRRGEP